MWGFHLLPRRLDAKVAIAGSGVPTLSNGLGIKAITRLAAGVYQIQLQDNYAQFLHLAARLAAPVTGSAVLIGALTPGVVYQITVVGAATTAQWITAGVPVGITPAVGVTFVALATSAGSLSACKAIGVSGISAVEIVGDTSTMLQNQPVVPLSGGFLTIQCLGATDASTTTLIPTDPISGSTLYIEIYLNDSQVQ